MPWDVAQDPPGLSRRDRYAAPLLQEPADRLDPFHLQEVLREGLCQDPEACRGLSAALGGGKPWPDVQALLEEAVRRTHGRFRDRLQQVQCTTWGTRGSWRIPKLDGSVPSRRTATTGWPGG